MAKRSLQKFPRGKLSQKLLDCLQHFSVFLQENLDAKSVVTELYSKMVFDDTDKDNVLGQEGCRNIRREQNRRLVSKLTMRTDEGFHAFLRALEDTGQEVIARKIQEWLRRNTVDLSDKKDESQDDYLDETDPQLPDEANSTISDNHEPLSKLQDRIGHVENRLDVLSTRVTRLDTSSSSQQKEEAEQLRKKLEEAKKEIKNLKQLLDYKSQDLAKAQAEITRLEQQLKTMREEQKVLEDKLKAHERKLKEQEGKAKEHESKIQILDRRLKEEATELENTAKKVCNLTEELKREKEQRKKEAEDVSKVLKELSSRLDDQARAIGESVAQNQQPGGSQAPANASDVDVQTGNIPRMHLPRISMQPSNQGDRQLANRIAHGKINCIKDNKPRKK